MANRADTQRRRHYGLPTLQSAAGAGGDDHAAGRRFFLETTWRGARSCGDTSSNGTPTLTVWRPPLRGYSVYLDGFIPAPTMYGGTTTLRISTSIRPSKTTSAKLCSVKR